MQISKYAIINKIQLLAATIYDEDAAKEQRVKLHTSFSSLDMTSEFIAKTSVPKLDPEEYIPDVTVNLYQLFNLVDVCDELIDIAVEGDELVVSSFFNQELSVFEMVTKIPIVDEFEATPDMGDHIETITFNQLNLGTIKNEFHNYKSEGGFYMVSANGNLKFYFSENGIESELIITEFQEYVMESDFTKFVSFRILELLLGAGGGLEGHKVDIYTNGIGLKDGNLEIIAIDTHTSEFQIPNLKGKDSLEKLFVFETDKFLSILDLSKRINKTTPAATFTLTSVPSTDGEEDTISVISENGGAMPIKSEVGMGVVEAISATIDIEPSIIFNILKATGVKYITLYRDSTNNKLALDYKNAVLEKKLSYDHVIWTESADS